MEFFDNKQGDIWNDWEGLANAISPNNVAVASPKTDIYGNKILSPDTTLTGNKFLSPDTNLKDVKLLSPDVKIQQEQAGLFNIKGTLDFSTKKSAMVYSPITITNSPFAKASNTPTIDSPLGGGNLPIVPLAMLGVVGVGIMMFIK